MAIYLLHYPRMRHFSKIKLLRRAAAVSLPVVAIAVLCLVYNSSFKEQRVSTELPASVLDPKAYHLVLDSIDAVAGKVQVHAEVALNRNGFLTTNLKTNPLAAIRELPLSFGPFAIQDLGETLESNGFWSAQSSLLISRYENQILVLEVGVAHEHNKLRPKLTRDVPEVVRQELTAIGDARLYPFDHYLLMGAISCQAFAYVDKDHPDMTVPGDQYRVDLRIPGFTLRDADIEELAERQKRQPVPDLTGLESSSTMKVDPNAQAFFKAMNDSYVRYNSDLWQHGAFAFVLERPLFLRVLAVFLGVVALLSVLYVAFGTEPKQMVLNAVGTFLGLWAVRQALSVDAPKTATLVDYATLGLYFLLIVIVFARVLWGFEKSDGWNPPS